MATRNEIAKLYVATFNRAADSEGLNYWDGTGTTSGAVSDLTDINEIAAAMLLSPEASSLYAGLNREDTVIRMYDNLFNRTVDATDSGVIYWVSGEGSTVADDKMILALINGALGTDATVVANKATVGIAFADAGMNDTAQAISVMQDVDATAASVTAALSAIGADNVQYLTTGQDIITGGAGDDTFIARGNGSLDNADIIDGGAGTDTIEVMLDNAETAESPLVTNVEILKVQAQATTSDSGDNDVEDFGPNTNIDAGDMVSVEQYWSEDSRADLTIEDVSRNSHITTIGMRETDPGDVDYNVFFDPENITTPGTISEGSTLEIKLANVLELAKGNNPLTGFTSLNFTVDGTEISVDLTTVTSYAAVDSAIEAALAAAGVTTVNVVTQAAEDVVFSTTIVDGGITYNQGSVAGQINPIYLVNTGSGDLVEGGIFDASGGSDGNVVKTMQDVGSTPIVALTQTDVILDRVGKDSKGGDLLIGSDSTGAYSGSAGIQQFNIDVDRTSWLDSVASTNDTLEVVNVENIGANGNLRIDRIDNIRVFDAAIGSTSGKSGMTGDANITVTLDSDITDKYLDLTDTATDSSADNSESAFAYVVDREFSYDFGSGNDTFNLSIDDGNLAAAGTATREDFVMEINGNAGNDTITTGIGNVDGSGAGVTDGFDSDAAYANAKENANLAINGGAGNDTITTAGEGDFIIDAGAGNDTVYSDNTGAKANWAVNAELGGAAPATPEQQTFTITADGADDGDETITIGTQTWNSATGTDADVTDVTATAAAIATDLNGTDIDGDGNADTVTSAAGVVTVTYFDTGADIAQQASAVGGTTNTLAVADATSVAYVAAVPGSVNVDDLDSAGVGATAVLYKAQLTVTYSGALGVNTEAAAVNDEGFESTVTIGTTDYVGNQTNVNQAIKDAINNDAVLSKLLVVQDGPANTLVITSLVDGVHASDDIEITVTAATLADLTTTEQNGIQNAFEILSADSTVTVAQGDLDAAATAVETASAPTIDDLGAAAANRGSDNTTNLGTGDDVLVLSTDADSAETIVFAGTDIGDNTIVNFTLGSGADGDILDFTSYLDDLSSASGSVNSQVRIATSITLNDEATLTANEIAIVNDFAAVLTDTWADMTAADVKAALDNTTAYANIAADVSTDAANLVGTTQSSILMIENDLNDGEYKVFDVTNTIATDTHVVTLLGTVDFGDSIDTTAAIA